MIYNPLLNASIVAFLLSATVISAQPFSNALSRDSFELLLNTDKVQLLQLGINKRLNTEQLRTFIPMLCKGADAPPYCAVLTNAYWEQLAPDEKLNYANAAFMDDFSSPEGTNYAQCVYEPYLNYLIAHQTECKNAWGDSLFTAYIRDKIYLSIMLLDVEWYKWRTPAPIQMCLDTANAYLARLETHLPDFVPYAKASLMIDFVYHERYHPKEFYFHYNNYAIEFIHNADVLYRMSQWVNKNTKESEYLQYALNIVDKAIKINPLPAYLEHKAVLVEKLAKKE